jgi:hypothetical protein
MFENIDSRLQNILARRKELDANSVQALQSMWDIADESLRVADYAHNARQTLDDLDAEFEKQTGLTKIDITFLFFATALQTARWILMPKLGDKIDSNSRLGHNDKSIKDAIKKKNSEFRDSHKDKWEVNKSKKGYKTWYDIIFNGAPYDVTKGSGNIGINMEGGFHRYKTLGHDPILGWIFGTANFITDTLTLNNTISYRIKNKQFTNETLFIPSLFLEVKASLDEDMHRLPAAVFAQGVHLASDKYTKLGLPIPILGSFSESLAGELYHNQYDVLCLEKDLKKIDMSAAIAMLINMIIGLVHGLYYQKDRDGQRKLYEIRTRRIITNSNLLASASNILYVAVSSSLGNIESIKKLDIGGFIVTLYRLFKDSAFIQRIKEEYISGNFREKIQNSDSFYVFE